MLCGAKLQLIFSFQSSLFTGKSRGENEEKSEERKEQKEKAAMRLFFFVECNTPNPNPKSSDKILMVDPRRVELLSENPLIQLSTGVGCLFYLPLSSPAVRIRHGQPFCA